MSAQELMRSLREIYFWGWTLCWTRCWGRTEARMNLILSCVSFVFFVFFDISHGERGSEEVQTLSNPPGAAVLWLRILFSWRAIHQQGAEESWRSCYLLTGDLCHSALVSAIAPPCQIRCVIIWREVRCSTINTSALDGSCGYHSMTSVRWKLKRGHMINNWVWVSAPLLRVCVCVCYACCNSPAVVIPLR